MWTSLANLLFSLTLACVICTQAFAQGTTRLNSQPTEAYSKQMTYRQRRLGRPPAEYHKPIPIHQAILLATEIRIYGQSRTSYTQSNWNGTPLARINSRTHRDMFHLLKTTKRFGEYGVKTVPMFLFIFVVPGQPQQGYIYNGVLSELSVTGEAAILPDAFNTWLRKYPYMTGMKMRKLGSK